MPLKDAYHEIEPSIVAFSPKYERSDQYVGFPRLIGTGFIVGDGVVATNDHVVRAIPKLPRPPNTPDDDWPVVVHAFRLLPEGMAMIPLSVHGAATIDLNVEGYYYGEERPDLGFVFVSAKGLPSASVSSAAVPLEPGVRVATAGFTMGTDALRAPGWVHQFVPTLQEGVVSAVLPFRCEKPHGVMINVMTQGGASGSPVFSPESGEVIGILYGGLTERTEATNAPVSVPLPTNFSYFVPAHYIETAVEGMKADGKFHAPSDAPTLEHLVDTLDRNVRPPQEHLQQVEPRVIPPPDTQ